MYPQGCHPLGSSLVSDPTGIRSQRNPGDAGVAPQPQPQPTRRPEPSAFQEAVAPSTQSLRLDPAGARPTDIANTNAVNAQREKAGLPPLPRRKGPRRPRRWTPLLRWVSLIAIGVVLAFLGTTAWAYVNGIIGPMRGDDRRVATMLTLADDTPGWATPGQLRCAAERIVRKDGVVTLAGNGVLTGTEGHYSYSGRWPSQLAQRWYDDLLGCSGAWAHQIAGAWSVRDDSCLTDLGRTRVAGVLAATGVALTDDRLSQTNAGTVRRLDSCYARTPAAPTGTSTRGYREVGVVVRRPAGGDGDTTLKAAGADPTAQTHDELTFRLPVARGGDRACVEARTQVTYAWGTTRLGETARICGTASPAGLAWRKVHHGCRSGVRSCAYEALYADGLASHETVEVTYRTSGGFVACPQRKRTCTVTVKADAGGRAHAPSLDVTGRRSGHIDARLGRLRALYPAG